MAYQKLGLGSSANDGTGDDLRTGGDKINENFEDLFPVESPDSGTNDAHLNHLHDY